MVYEVGKKKTKGYEVEMTKVVFGKLVMLRKSRIILLLLMNNNQ
jgi:hypothetical protein